MKRVNIIVTGKVQGVGFRAFVQNKAVETGISGWTRNLPDGSVEIEAEGPAEKIETFLLRIAVRTSSYIYVDSLKTTEILPCGGKGFSIRR